MYRSKEGVSGFGRTDGRTDGQPENIMPPAPKGGDIKILVNGPLPIRSKHNNMPNANITPEFSVARRKRYANDSPINNHQINEYFIISTAFSLCCFLYHLSTHLSI